MSVVLQVAGADGSMANTVVGTPQYLPPGEIQACSFKAAQLQLPYPAAAQ
jgi:hypothetical protein